MNTEFEAKTIVGQIKSEPRKGLWTTSVDEIANNVGVSWFRSGKVNVSEYQIRLSQWHNDPRLSSYYSRRTRTNATPNLLMRLVQIRNR